MDIREQLMARYMEAKMCQLLRVPIEQAGRLLGSQEAEEILNKSITKHKTLISKIRCLIKRLSPTLNLYLIKSLQFSTQKA